MMVRLRPHFNSNRPLGSLRLVRLLLAAAFATAPAGAQTQPAPPTHDYWVYVGAESADLMHRIRFGRAGAVVERTIPIGESPVEMEGPHGLQISKDGKY